MTRTVDRAVLARLREVEGLFRHEASLAERVALTRLCVQGLVKIDPLTDG